MFIYVQTIKLFDICLRFENGNKEDARGMCYHGCLQCVSLIHLCLYRTKACLQILLQVLNHLNLYYEENKRKAHAQHQLNERSRLKGLEYKEADENQLLERVRIFCKLR